MASIGDLSVRMQMILKSKPQHCIPEITLIIDTSPIKDLQTIYPQLVNHIFETNRGWGLRTTTPHTDIMKYDLLYNFLSPFGPFFRLCYKLLGDHQLKYQFPLHLLPVDVYQTLESGRFPQYYADQILIEPHAMHIISLYLNPFDYYIFYFAAHVHSLFPSSGSWESWNTVYFSLACDYLLHFLPSNPNTVVLPEIPFYTGKAPSVTSLQTSSRLPNQQCSLLKHDLIGLNHDNSSSELHPRNEVWRSETVQQVFIDFWLSTSDLMEVFQGNSNHISNSIGACTAWTERVRIARALVKAIHAWSNAGAVGIPGSPAVSENESLRRSARKSLKIRAYNLIRALAEKWPLDASFRLPLEFWLSFIQPWRYCGEQIERSLSSSFQANQTFRSDESGRPLRVVDQTFKSFIAENLPAYTNVFQMIVPRFMRLDLTAPKNAIMLYRLTKVFAQSNLVPMLQELEKSVVQTFGDFKVGKIGIHLEDTGNQKTAVNYSYSSSPSYWSHHPNQIYDEAMEGLNVYVPLWTLEWQENARQLATKISIAKNHTEKLLTHLESKEIEKRRGIFGHLKYWFMTNNLADNEFTKEETRRVPFFLNNSLQHIITMFNLEDTFFVGQFASDDESATINDSNNSFFSGPGHLQFMSSRKIRDRTISIKYMGDPDLQPIKSSENVILVQLLHKISANINEKYRSEILWLWNRRDILGDISREVLSAPCTTHNYLKGLLTSSVVSCDLPPRLTLRPLASHSFIAWTILICLLFKFFGFSVTFFVCFVLAVFCFSVLIKVLLRKIGLLSRDYGMSVQQ